MLIARREWLYQPGLGAKAIRFGFAQNQSDQCLLLNIKIIIFVNCTQLLLSLPLLFSVLQNMSLDGYVPGTLKNRNYFVPLPSIPNIL